MKTMLILAAAAGTMLSALPVAAQSVLYRNDGVIGTDNMGAALNTIGYSVTSTAGSLAGYDLSSYNAIVYANQNAGQPASDTALLSAYIAAGGRVIYDNWSRTASELPTLNAVFSGSTNQTAMTLATGQSLTLSSPGFAVFSDGLTTQAGGTVAATFANGDAAIVVGNGGRTIFNGFLTGTLTGSQLYQTELRSIFAAPAVPEPATWGMMIVGFALIGATLRRRQKVAATVSLAG